MSAATKIKTTKFETVFTPQREATDATRTWAATIFGDVPEEIVFCDRDCKRHNYKAKTRRDKDGHYFRTGFHITQGVRGAIRIHLYRGSTFADLRRARCVVERAREGLELNLWDQATTWEGHKMIAWLQVDPDKYSPEIRPCRDTNCVSDYHEWETRSNEPYPTEACEHETTRTDHYTIILQRHHGERWEVASWQTTDELTAEEGLKALRDWANDFAYLLGEADRLNALDKASTEVLA